MTLTIASMNIDRAGAAKFQNTLAFTQHFQADAYALQQLDINDLEMPRYVHSWRQAGAQLILSRPELPNNCRRVGLATSLPVRPFPLKGSLAATRVAAGLVQVQSAGQVRPLVLAAMYGFPNDYPATNHVVQQFLDEVRPLKCMYVLFGDFNWQRGDGGLLDTLLSDGRLRCLDDDFHGLLPGTSPSRSRRIDFAVGHPLIAATRIDHGSANPRAFDPVPMPNADRGRSLRAPRASRGLAGLRRLGRRLQQLELEPYDHDLRRRIKASLSGLRELVPQLPYLSGDLRGAGELVGQLIQELQSQEAEAGLEAWQATDKSFAHCCSWVKRRADQAQACFAEPKEIKKTTATHPTKILEDQSEVWTSLWMRPANRQFDGEALQQVLSELPRPDPLQVDLHITAEGLRKAMHKMLRKAGGADGWEATDLVRLPDPFWAAAARLWNRALETGRLPSSWTRALVVLIPKPDGRTRPIGLMSLLWRAGARILVKQLRAWSHSWTTAAAMGGLVGVGVADAHLRLLGAYNRGTRSYFKQDLSHFFDSLSLDVLIPLLEHYRAPPMLTQLIQALYSDSQRLFKVQGFTAQDFTRVNTGVIQGCPLSPLLSLLVGQAWATYAVGQSSAITAMVYIDDRGLWPKARHPHAVDEMRAALRRSDFFDRALELQCKSEKCALAHSPQDSSMVALAEERHYECRSVLEFLGIRFDLLSQECSPLKLNLGNLRWRLRYIKRLGAPLSMLKLLISALVGAALVWAGGVAKPEDKELRAIADELYYLLQGNFLRDTPRLLLHELRCAQGGGEVPFEHASLEGSRAACRGL